MSGTIAHVTNIHCIYKNNFKNARRNQNTELRSFRPSALAAMVHLAVIATSLGIVPSALANPQGGHIVGGTGSISQPNASTTVVKQNSNNMIVNWNSFDVGQNEKVQFIQPSSTATALNRIYSNSPSQIFGNVTANGRIILLNGNGFLIGSSATLNMGSLVVSTLDMSNKDFMANRFKLKSGGGEGRIVNEGLIQASSGSVALIGNSISNEGVIVANAGTVTLASGKAATLDFTGDGLLRVEVTESVIKNAAGVADGVLNNGQIQAGQVLLTAKAAQDVFSHVVNNEGVIRAAKIDTSGGTIRLVGSGGETVNSGELNAGGSSGGRIEVLGDRVTLTDTAKLNASATQGSGGTILVGGDFHGEGAIKTASVTSVVDGATIKADAGTNGDGGKVAVWADGTTHFGGSISAKGGSVSGNGGFAEVSGKKLLDLKASAKVDLTAQHGQKGTLLLDPANISIVADNIDPDVNGDGAVGDDITNANQLSSSSNFDGLDSIIHASSLSSLLNGGSDVILAATNDITLAVDAHVTWGTIRGLTLTAGRYITLAGSISNVRGASSLSLNFGTALNVTGDLSGFNGSVTATGGSAATIIGGNDYAINGVNSGVAAFGTKTVTFSGVQNLTGSSGDDTFTFNTGGSLSGSIAGGGGSDTLIGLANYTITGTNSGTATGIGGGFSGIANLTGTSGNDTFTFSNGGHLDGSVDGVSGTDTLTILTGQADQTVSGLNTAIAAAINGSSIHNIDTKVIAGTGAGTLTLDLGGNAGITGANAGTATTLTSGWGWSGFGSLTGNNSNNTFTLSSGGSLSGAITGGGGSDTLIGSTAYNITGANSGTATGIGSFAGIQNLTGTSGDDTFTLSGGSLSGTITGGGGTDTLIGSTSYAITGANSGTALNNIGGGSLTFSGIRNLTGTSGDDSFTFSGSGSLGGTADGLGGTDSLVIQAGANQTVTQLETAITNHSVTVANIERRIVAGTGTLTLDQGGDASISGANAGTATALTSGWEWSGFGSLTGSSGNNTFTLAGGSLTGTINGGGGNDTLIGSTTYTITGTNSGTATGITGGFSNIQNLTGTSGDDTFTLSGGSLSGAIVGGGGNDTLAGSTTYTITGTNSGTATGVAGGFSGIQNLTGTGGNDSFTFNGGSLSGNVDGLGGTDTVTIQTGQANQTVSQLNVAVATAVAGSFNNIETKTISGTGAGALTLDLGGDASITGTNAGTATTLASGWGWSGFVSLTGSTGNNTFTLAGGSLSGTIDGGGGSGNDTLAGSATYTITGANSGTAAGVAGGFTNIQNLTGTGGNDSFTFDGGSLSGSVDGLGGTDTVTLQTGQANRNISDLNAAITALSGSIVNVEIKTVAGSGTGTLTLDLGGDASITGANAGTATTLASGWGWSGFGSLVGNTGNNIFTLAGGSLTGAINGGGGNDTLIGSTTYTITGVNSGTATGIASGFSNIQNLTGTGGDDTFTLSGGSLTGTITGGGGNDTLAGSTNYTITGANSGTASGVGSFIGIQNLVGTSGNDTFTLAGGSLSGTINGSGGNDTLAGSSTYVITGVNSGSAAGIAGGFTSIESLTGTGGDDTFTLSGGSLSGAINGAGGNDTLIGSTSYTITGANSGTASGIGSFSDIENLTGTAGNDTFTLSGGSLSGAINGAGGNDTLTGSTSYTLTAANGGTAAGVGSFSDIENLTGTGGDDTFTLAGGSLSGTINGGGGNDTLAGSTAYVITGANSGTAMGVGGGFSGIQNLTGSAGDDTFTLSGGSLNGTINGGGGSDTLIGFKNYVITGANSGAADGLDNFVAVQNLTGTSGDDKFTLAGGSLSGTISGAGGDNTLAGSTAYVIAGADSGAATGVGSFSNTQNLIGNSGGNTTFTLADGSLSGTIQGLRNNNTLIGSTHYRVTGLDRGQAKGLKNGISDAPNTDGFTGIQNLTGRSGAANEFDLSRPKAFLSGKVDGGSSNSNNVLDYPTTSPQPTGTNGTLGSGYVLLDGRAVYFSNIFKTQARFSNGLNDGTANVLTGPVNADAARNDNAALFVIESSFFDPSLQIFSVVDTGVSLPCDQSESGGCGGKVEAQQLPLPSNFRLAPVPSNAAKAAGAADENRLDTWFNGLKVDLQTSAQNNKTKIPLASL